MKIKLLKTEVSKLIKLSRDAQNTPMIAFSSEMALSGRDAATIAHEAVQNYWKALAKKYKFKVSNYKSLNPKTRVLEA